MNKKRFLFNIDDMSVRTKLLLLYFLCVFIPIFVINSVFYQRLSNNIEEQTIERLNVSLDKIMVNLRKNIEGCISIANTFYTDRTLNNALEREYSSTLEYTNVYTEFLQNRITTYMPIYDQVREINIYTDNPTIIKSGGILPIDEEAKNSDWYEKVINTKNTILVHAYIEPYIDEFNNEEKHNFSVVKKLDLFKSLDSKQKLVKIDLEWRYIEELFESERLKGDLFIINQNNEIVYSNNESYFNDGFDALVPFKEYKYADNTFTLTKTYDTLKFIKDWRIVGVFPEDQFLDTINESRNFVVLMTFISLLFVTSLILYISRSFTVRLTKLSNYMRKVRQHKFETIDLNPGNDEIGQAISNFNRMTIKIDSLIHDVYLAGIQKKNLELEKKQAELNALQSQINPHFLFNTLNTIRVMSVLKKQDDIAQLTKNLANTFRRLLTWEEDLVKLKDELEFVEEYLIIEKYRFKDKIDYSIYCDPQILDFRIPKLSIQPLVENACIHGIQQMKKKGLVKIFVEVVDDNLIVNVEDNGVGMDQTTIDKMMRNLQEESNESSSVGIRNVFRRFHLYYGDKFEFNIKSQLDIGTKIKLIIPINKV